MCLSADEVNPLCDECFAGCEEEAIHDEAGLCDGCQEIASKFCGCCFQEYESSEEADLKSGLCWRCRGES